MSDVMVNLQPNFCLFYLDFLILEKYFWRILLRHIINHKGIKQNMLLPRPLLWWKFFGFVEDPTETWIAWNCFIWLLCVSGLSFQSASILLQRERNR